jgi:hypothetical protein
MKQQVVLELELLGACTNFDCVRPRPDCVGRVT